MVRVKIVAIILMLEFLFFCICYSQSYENVTELYRYLLDDNKNSRMIRPILNQSEPVRVQLQLFLHKLVKFDDVNGLLYILATVGMLWIDEFKVWDSGHFGLSKIHFMGSEVWTPDIRLINQGGQLLSVRCTAPEDEVTYDDKGHAYCFIAHQFVISCSPNMFRFPFDEHKCSLQFQPKAIDSEILLETPKLESDVDFEDTFLQWKLTPLNLEMSKSNKFPLTKVTYFVLLQRNPYFLMINVVLPNCVLGIVHLLVFYLPIETGERISYSITIYLALVVFMSNISSMLPQTSNPISVFNVMIFTQLCFSSCIMAAVIFISRLYYTDTKKSAPSLLVKIFLRKKIGKVHQEESSGFNAWNEIGKSLDKVMFYFFLFCMCSEVVIVFLLNHYN